MITVVNKRANHSYSGQPYCIYIGRPSPLGNTFSIEKHGRDKCIQLFREYLYNIMSKPLPLPPGDALVREAMHRLVRIHEKYDQLVLECWCKPQACHGDVIKECLEEMLS